MQINPNFRIYSQEADLQAVLDEAVTEAQKISTIIGESDKKTLQVIQRLQSLLIPPHDCQERFKDKAFGERISVVYPAYEAALSNTMPWISTL